MSQIRIVIYYFLLVIGVAMPVLAQSTAQAESDSIKKLLLTAVLAVISGGITAFFTTKFRLKEFRTQSEIQQEMEKKREELKIRVQYLNPLRISTKDLNERIEEIIEKMLNEEDKINLTNNFSYINENSIANRREFEKWCNIDGYFCMATLYTTSIYFSRANKIRSELPFVQLNPSEDEKLLDLLSKVRGAFGGRHGIWETIQDSIGTYIRREDGSLMNYREFCGEVADSNKHIWFRSLIDFYVEFHKKLKHEVPKIIPALEELIKFLEDTQKRKVA